MSPAWINAQFREVTQAGLTLAGQPLTITRSPRGMSGSLLVKTGGQLELTLADQDGIGPSPAPRFALNLAEDRKPVVSLSGPRPKEAVTARADCDVGRFGLEAPLKPKHVRDAHGVRKKAKHGHIIRRVSDEDELLWVGV